MNLCPLRLSNPRRTPGEPPPLRGVILATASKHIIWKTQTGTFHLVLVLVGELQKHSHRNDG